MPMLEEAPPLVRQLHNGIASPTTCSVNKALVLPQEGCLSILALPQSAQEVLHGVRKLLSKLCPRSG